ncbi:MAG: hypothetical protein HC936_04090 [Leptolyngbyaceae cyanobacterium SU_3_3]|nr:hypothetical protein [Leptolyngbyaceae cyanobacterium SU_3_3]
MDFVNRITHTPILLIVSFEDKFRHLTLLNGIRHEMQWLAWCEEAIAIFMHHLDVL